MPIVTKDVAIAWGIEAESMLYDVNKKDRRQLEFIYDLATQAPNGAAVEVGIHHGGSIVTWGQARRGRGRVIAVDNRRTTGYAAAFAEKMAKYGLVAELLEVNSVDAPPLIDEALAFCFIDADHSYRGISMDVTARPDKIMPGGVICYHDYGVWKPNVAVKALVDFWQMEAQWEQTGLVGSLIAFRRPK